MNENTPRQIILFKDGELSATDSALLKAAGYIPIQVATPESVVMLFPDGQKLKGDDIFQAAIKSITGPQSGSEREKFASAVIKSVLKETP